MVRLFRRILVPHDFSTSSRQALKVAIDLAAEHGGRVHVVHAVTPYYMTPEAPPSPGVYLDPESFIAAAKKMLAKDIAKVVGRRRLKVRSEVLIGEAAQVILDLARKADSIVMATMGRTGLERLLIGSVAERVVRHSPIPVLTVRGRKTKR
jgi:nucleotide-binding universal stress UspA family protein